MTALELRHLLGYIATIESGKLNMYGYEAYMNC